MGFTLVFANLRLIKVLLRRSASANCKAPSSPNSTSNKSTCVSPILTFNAFAMNWTPVSPNLFYPRFKTFRYGLTLSDWESFFKSLPIKRVRFIDKILSYLDEERIVPMTSAPPFPRKLWSSTRILMLVGKGASLITDDFISNWSKKTSIRLLTPSWSIKLLVRSKLNKSSSFGRMVFHFFEFKILAISYIP